jgi:hypothetical protein
MTSIRSTSSMRTLLMEGVVISRCKREITRHGHDTGEVRRGESVNASSCGDSDRQLVNDETCRLGLIYITYPVDTASNGRTNLRIFGYA